MVQVAEMNSRDVKRDVLSIVTKAGCSVSYISNLVGTKKGTNSSRSMSTHVELKDPNGNIRRFKFDPQSKQARSKTSNKFVIYDPNNEDHKKLMDEGKIYVRVPADGYQGDYDKPYEVYEYVSAGGNGQYPSYSGTVGDSSDFSKLVSR